ncbi:MAG: hypothetical protein HYY68_08495 [Thaumarchaeota archaeon]|nr:hypothetical protein [Nitrososphaerota archaeon]
MVPSLKKRVVRHADTEPDLLNVDIVLLSSILQIQKELGCGELALRRI